MDEYCRFILQQAEHAAQGQGGTQLPPPQQQGPRRGLLALHASEAAAALARLDVGFHWASWGRELEQKGLQPIQVCMQAWCMWWLSHRASLTSVQGFNRCRTIWPMRAFYMYFALPACLWLQGHLKLLQEKLADPASLRTARHLLVMLPPDLTARAVAVPIAFQEAAVNRQQPAEPERSRKRSRSPAAPSDSGSDSSSDSRLVHCQGPFRSPSRDLGSPPPAIRLCPMLLRHFKHARRGKPTEEWVLTGCQLFVSGLPKPGAAWMPDLLDLVLEAGGTGALAGKIIALHATHSVLLS